jgi:hypothetical protein
MLALKLNSFLKESQASSRRFASVPGEVNLRPGSRFEVLEDVSFQQIFRHPKHAGIGVEAAFVPIVTIAAIEIAHGPSWFDEELKFTGGLGQGVLLTASLIELRITNYE